MSITAHFTTDEAGNNTISLTGEVDYVAVAAIEDSESRCTLTLTPPPVQLELSPGDEDFELHESKVLFPQ